MEFLALAIVLWVVPIFVARSIGDPKGRYGTAYGLFLGWLGVVAVYMLPAVPEEKRGRL
jgi:hypothetical protein